jgi:hypothetical protein
MQDLRFTEMDLKSSIFWDTTPCSPFKVNRRFGKMSPPSSGLKNRRVLLDTCFHAGILLGLLFGPEDGGDIYLQNIG